MQKPFLKIFAMVVMLSALSAVEHQVINPDADPDKQTTEIRFQFDGVTKTVSCSAAEAQKVLQQLEGFTAAGPLLINPQLVQFIEAEQVTAQIMRLHIQFAGFARLIEVSNAAAESILATLAPESSATPPAEPTV